MDNIADLLAARLATPARVLYRQLVDDARREFTAAELARRAARWQAAFRREGLRPGDRIAIGLRNGVAWVARVRRVIVAPEPWTVENGLLTPTLKIRREQVLKRFADEIDSVYAAGAPTD